MQEFSYAEMTLIVIALREMLKKEVSYSDRMVMEGILGKLLISQKAIRIREAMNTQLTGCCKTQGESQC